MHDYVRVCTVLRTDTVYVSLQGTYCKSGFLRGGDAVPGKGTAGMSVMHQPSSCLDCLRQAMVQKVLSGSLIEFYNFPPPILELLGLWFLKDCKHLWDEGLVVLAQMINVASPAAHLLRCQGSTLITDKPSSGKYLSGKMFSFFSQSKEFLRKLVNLWQASGSEIIPFKLLFFCFNFLRNSVEGFC